MFELEDANTQDADIKVIGVGGGGGNAVEHMMASKIDGVDFICANTDAQALRKSTAPTILQIGEAVTKGLGAGANPEVGRKAAMEDKERIAEVLAGSDMVFITAGMGGGTGTGGAPVIAQIAKEMGILTVAVVTKPFPFEMRKRLKSAEEGIKQLAEHVDSLIIIPNEKLLTVLGKETSLMDAFKEANNVLFGAVQGISDLIIRPGVMNVDFADVRTVMMEKGNAMIGTGYSSGENRASEAAELAIASPFLEDIDLSGAGGVLVNITAGMDLGIGEFVEVGNIIEGIASDETTVIVGTVLDADMGDEIKVTVIATGLSHGKSISSLPSSSLPAPERIAPTLPSIPRNNDGRVPYSNYDKPTTLRKEAQRSGGVRESSSSMEHLDMPAFLRRQAD